MSITIRLAQKGDLRSLEALIPVSARALQAAHYSPAQIEAALGTVFGVDRQLIDDRTYFVAESEGRIVGCGGWSKRKTLYGGDHTRKGEDPLLDPLHEPARIRAFFVHPDFVRRGIGRQLMLECEAGAFRAGFLAIEIVATLAGEPLYASFDYAVIGKSEIKLTNGMTMPVVHMSKKQGIKRLQSGEG